MENQSWKVIYRNRDNGQRIAATVFAEDQQQALERARADGLLIHGEVWEVESVEPHKETLARILITEFAKRQQNGHFACPRCGLSMNEESAARNALSRRVHVYVCEACGMMEALEDMTGSRTPLSAWAITADPDRWGGQS